MPDASRLIFPAPKLVALPIAGDDRLFPVRRIYCVGRNYAAHAREMGGDERAAPFFFQKPTDAIVISGEAAYPPATLDLQFEVELVLAIGKGGRDIPIAQAAAHVFGLAVGIDLTRRDRQAEARQAGQPWEVAKAFDQSAPIGPLQRLEGALPRSGRISLSLNGDIKQDGDLSEMIWQADEIVCQLSALFALEPGDLIYTGTPAGVGRIETGDRLEGRVDGLAPVSVEIV